MAGRITRLRQFGSPAGALRPIQRELDNDDIRARTLLGAASRWRRRVAPSAPEPARVNVPQLSGTKAKGGLGGGTAAPGLSDAKKR